MNYAVFINYPPDPNLELFETYEEAKRDFESMKKENLDGIGLYLVKVVDVCE
jgi:hypothetical protein